MKKYDVFLIFPLNIVCGFMVKPTRCDGFNDYLHSMLRAKTEKIMYTPVHPIFTKGCEGLLTYMGVLG